MASDSDFVQYVMEQIRNAGLVVSKKMFGEYMVYVNQKPALLICNNTVYVKKLDCVRALLENSETGIPYKGAKEHYIPDVDDGETLLAVVREIEKVTPAPKPKKKKQ